MSFVRAGLKLGGKILGKALPVVGKVASALPVVGDVVRGVGSLFGSKHAQQNSFQPQMRITDGPYLRQMPDRVRGFVEQGRDRALQVGGDAFSMVNEGNRAFHRGRQMIGDMGASLRQGDFQGAMGQFRGGMNDIAREGQAMYGHAQNIYNAGRDAYNTGRDLYQRGRGFMQRFRRR